TWPTRSSPPTHSAHADAAELLVTSKQAHYLFQVKANQPTLLARCQRRPWHRVPVADRTRNRGHGRIEHRTLKVVTVGHFGFPTPPRSCRSPASAPSAGPSLMIVAPIVLRRMARRNRAPAWPRVPRSPYNGSGEARPPPCSSTRPVGLPTKESTSSTFRSRRTTSPPCGSTAGSASLPATATSLACG